MSDYMNFSKQLGIQHPHGLSKAGQRLINQHPYNTIAGVSLYLCELKQEPFIGQSHSIQSSSDLQTVSMNDDLVRFFR